MEHVISWIALAEILGPRSHLLRPLLAHFKTPEAVFEADEAALRAALPDIGAGTLSSILHKRSEENAKHYAHWCRQSGIRVLTYDSPEYPACLRDLDEPPAVLYCKGKMPAMDKRLAIGVVGARKADAYGEQVAYKLSFEMAAAGAVIVSGLAEGVDGIASAAAINAGGESIAVLGCGIDIVYPKQHTRLAAEVANSGCVISEFSPGTMPNGWNFPIRNRLISALSGAVLVVEAGEKSGALITARYAVVQGKTLFAVPGDITSPRSVGTNRLLYDGALPALCAEDILGYFHFLYRDALRLSVLPEAMQYSTLTPEALRPFGMRMTQTEAPVPEEKPQREGRKRRPEREQAPEAPQKKAFSADVAALTPRQREIYSYLPDTAFSVDVLAACGVPVSEAVSTLTVFEIYGLIHSIPGGMFEKN